MKNKKGFTLVELLAVIVILGILLMIGNMSIDAIALRVRKNQHENLVKKIKIAAEKYFDDKHVTSVNVITLIENGYISADNDKNEIKSPETGEDLKCYIVSKNDENIDFNKALCDGDATIENMDIKIVYCFNEAGTNCYSINDSKNDEWQNGMKKTGSGGTAGIIYLRAYRVSNSELLSSGKFKWTNPINPDKTYNTASVKIDFRPGSSNNGTFNELFQLSYTENNKEYTATKQVKLDSIKPTCIINNISNDITPSGLTYDLVCEDTGGSDVYICNNKNQNKITYNAIKETQKYTAKDNAGNISDECSIKINNRGERSGCSSKKSCSSSECLSWKRDVIGRTCSGYGCVTSGGQTLFSVNNGASIAGAPCGNGDGVRGTIKCTGYNNIYSDYYCGERKKDCTKCGCETYSNDWKTDATCNGTIENYNCSRCRIVYYQEK